MRRYIYMTNESAELFGWQDNMSGVLQTENGDNFSIAGLIRDGWVIAKTSKKPL